METANIKAHDRKSLGCFEETVGENMDIKCTSVEVSEGKEKHYLTL